MTVKPRSEKVTQLRPRITVVGVGGAGSNAVNNMIAAGLTGVNFVVANTDSQSLANSNAESRLQLGAALTEGLGAGAKPEVGRAAAEESVEDIRAQLIGSHMVFVAAGMGGGTGTGAAAVIARVARETGALTVGVVTKPFQFEGTRRMRMAEAGINALRGEVDTLIVIPNQNLFRIANERTTFAESFVMADQVLYSGIACVVDLIVNDGLINLDFADVRAVMSGMGTAMMGTGEAAGERRAVLAAEEAISNPLLDDISLRGARGLLVSITGNHDMTLYEVDEAATRVRQEVDPEANIIVGATFDDKLDDRIRVSIVASGMDRLTEAAMAGWQGPVDARAAPYIAPIAVQAEPAPTAYGQRHSTPQSYDASPAAAEYSGNDGLSGLVSGRASQPTSYDVIGTHHLPVESALTRALSDALGPREETEPHYAPQHIQQLQPHPPHNAQQPAWSSQSGAVFEEAPPQLGSAPMPAHAPHNAMERHLVNEPMFAPQPPAEVRRPARRLPEVADFPAVGQRDYLAKSSQYAEPPVQAAPAAPPRAYSNPAPEPPRKLGFFERLTGAKRKAAANPQPSTTDQQVAARPDGHRDQAACGSRSRPADAGRGAAHQNEEQHDLPVFFGAERK